MNLKTFGKFLVMGVLVASMTTAMAQGGGAGGGGGRGGGGQGRGGFGQGRMGGFGQGAAQLANRADVQSDIKATDEQKKSIAALQDKLQEDRRAMMQDLMGGGGPPDQDEMRKAMEKFNEKAKSELAKILEKTQMTRLDEIAVQLQGGRAILLPAVQKALGLSAETIAKAADLQQKQNAANMVIFEKVRNQEITREEMTAAMEKNNKALDEELAKLLTPDQAAKLKELGGKPFKADPPRGGGGL
jgi:hypothetical protein